MLLSEEELDYLRSSQNAYITKKDIELFKMTDEGKAYLKYNDEVGGEPIGLVVPFGYPDGVEEMGGVIKVYEECIRQQKPWEELLNYSIEGNAQI